MSNTPRTSSTVSNALRLLRLLAAHPQGMGVSEIANELGLAKSGTHMLLSTLVQQEFAFRDDASMYFLGLTAFEVGSAVPDAARFGGELLGPARNLADVSGEAVSLAVLRNREAVMVQRFETRHVLRADIGVGTRMPVTDCASGKVFLAALSEAELDDLLPDEDLGAAPNGRTRSKSHLKTELAEVRAQRYAMTVGEYADGVTGVAAGVYDRQGRLAVALSVAGPSTRFDIEKWVPPLLTGADEMTALMAARH
ncbi:IclR family transcriptional regulator [Rhodococcus sp. IEGM 1307]|uniref:IclR family transcriptional regulator n=1 Tax=Rhodococcus sp. IEGM 1307 TaxID=3047091 RepID=UPI0024B872E8|nr:IclR family transcriptional regulator [Rhodococcus sp. IEGM 1307]MDI9979541.1 IclR family transcriptional regulator [Rhodococcus sp. IEGM 1307]